MTSFFPLVMPRSYLYEGRKLPLGVFLSDPQGEYDFHRHDRYVELVIVVGGRGAHLVGDMNYPIGSGDVFVIPGGQEHAYARVEKLAILNVLYDPDELRLPLYDLASCPGYQVLFNIDPGFMSSDRFDNRFRLDDGQLREARAIVDRMDGYLRDGVKGGEFLAVTNLLRLIGYLVSNYERCGEARLFGALPYRLGILTGHMEDHFAEPLSASDMGRIACMSRANLFRLFRRHFGKTPLEYLTDIRLRHAREMLAASKYTVLEIALRCGFSDGNYLTRQFHRRCGVTPGRFRNNFRR